MSQKRNRVSTRVRVAEVLAFVGLVAALVGGLGPADAVSTTYSWPPPEVPESTPDRLWYSPLLLARHQPAAINATIPCTLPPALDRSASPVTALATARSPAEWGGLEVTPGSRASSPCAWALRSSTASRSPSDRTARTAHTASAWEAAPGRSPAVPTP